MALTPAIIHYLELLADPSPRGQQALQAFRQNPDAAMHAHGLNDDERAVLGSRDEARIRQALSDYTMNTMAIVTG
jgi:hypothetical protein